MQASANEDLPFDEYGVRVNSSEANQQLLADEEWVNFDNQTDVALDKVWKINFSAIATPNKIKAITIEHKDKPIKVIVNYNSSKIVTVKPDKRFIGSQNYTLKILLTNGKKYKMDFVTTKADKEPNNTYKQASILYVDETIQGDLLVNSLDKTDFYKINVPRDGQLNVNIRRLDTANTVSLYLYGVEGNDGDLLAYAENKTSALIFRELKAGDYYIQVSGSGRYEIKTSFAAKTVKVEDALQSAQDAVFALPAPMDVTAEHNDAIRTALTLIATAKILDADPIALEKLENIIAELQKIVLPIKITAATDLNSSTFEVRFNRAVDTSVALFTVNNGVKVKTVTFNTNKTVAKVEMASKLNVGSTNKEYTLEVHGVVSGILTEKVIVVPETVESIEILGNQAVRVAVDKASISFKVENQYGEGMMNELLTVKVGNGVESPANLLNGTVTFTISTTAEEGEFIELTLNHASGKSATKTVKVSTQASVMGITVKGIYHEDVNNTLKETTNLSAEKFYLLIEATDQHGAPINDLSILNAPNVISLVQTDPTIVKFAATTGFMEIKNALGQVLGIGLPLTGTPKLGETEVTLTAIASSRKSSLKVKVAESTRTDEIALVVPPLITEGEDLFIKIDAKDKESHAITDLAIIKSAVSGIKFTVTPNIPYNIKADSVTDEIGIVVDKSNVIAGNFTIKAESSTNKVVTKTITVKGKAIPVTWEEISTNSILKSINLADANGKKPQSIDETKVRFIDQYGNPIIGLPAGYSLVVTDGNPTGGAVSVVNNTITPIAVGTEMVTIGIKNGTAVVAGSEKTIKFTVVNGDYIAYEVEDIGIVYDEIAAGKTARVPAYDKAVNVYGVLSDGTTIPLKYGVNNDFTLDAVHPTLRKDIQVDGILKIDTTAADQYNYGSASEINAEVTVIINSSGEKYKQRVPISKSVPKVVKIQSSLQNMSYNPTPPASFDFAELVGATNITALDQYGIESKKLLTPDYQFEFPDGTKTGSKVGYSTFTGDHLFKSNNTKDAVVTDFSSQSSFNAVVSVENVFSNPIKVAVEDGYMPTVIAEAGKFTNSDIGILGNNDNISEKVQSLVGIEYIIAIKSSSNNAIATNGKVTQMAGNESGNVVFTVTNKTKPSFFVDRTINLTVSAATKVTLAAGSLGTAGDRKITGLTVGSKYVVAYDNNFYGVKADGTLNTAQANKEAAGADAGNLIGVTIDDLINGATYKVEAVAPTEVILSGPIGTAGDKKITGLTATTKYVVTEGATKYYGVLANGTLSVVQTNRPAAEALAVALSGTTITGLTNGTTYNLDIASAVALVGVTATAGDTTATIRFTAPTGATIVKVEKLAAGGIWEDAHIAGLTSTSMQATATGLNNGTPYQFRVIVTEGSYAGTSNETVAVTPVSLLNDITAIAGDQSASITFTAPAGATTVKVQQSTDGNTWSYANTILLDAASTSAEVKGLKNGTTYYFRLEVVGGAHAGISNRTTNITPVATILNQVIAGITVPVRGGTPVTKIADTTEYTATIIWSPNTTPFEATKPYTATITIKPKLGFTLEGIVENFFTVAGATTVTNAANSGIVTAVFPETEVLPVGP